MKILQVQFKNRNGHTLRGIVTLPDTVQVEKTQTAETAVLYEDADGREVSPRRAALTEWRWSVADDTIAEVDPSGIVTGLRGGSTTLTLQSADGKISASCPRRSTLLCMSSVTLPTPTTARLFGRRWRRCCRIISSGNGC